MFCPASFTTPSARRTGRSRSQKARDFILARFAEPPDRPSLLDADRIGYTRDEADRLASPLPPMSPRGLYWAMMRANMRARRDCCPRASRSAIAPASIPGSTLDYVYRNEPRGAGPLGRLIDRNYLNSIGWRGIRQRKLHVEELLARSRCGRWRDKGMPVRVVDIAAGHGRYVLDALGGKRHNAGLDPAARLQRPQRRRRNGS